MAKLTRKSYKRKKIAFAAILLGGVALVSSGFAAWVLSGNVEKKEDGGVSVGKVVTASLNMNITLKKDGENYEAGEGANGAFYFEPVKDDTYANTSDEHHRVVRKDEDKWEQLSLTYKVIISSDQNNLKELNVKMAEKDNGTKVQSAITANYIGAPKCLEANGETKNSKDLTAATPTENTDGDYKGKYTWSIDYTVAFTWGSAFGGMNPADYYDKDAKGLAVPLYEKDLKQGETESVEGTLKDLHSKLDEASFELTFTAISM